MACLQFSELVSKFRNNFLETLKLKRKSRRNLDISAPFNFKEGPTMHFPGYSEDDISLMREKAIASTAIVSEDSELDLPSRFRRPHSSASLHRCGLASRVSRHARRVSRTIYS
ncbi:hypothetical protein B0O99DRAFT_688674 [Bisporella sp. PMI_857]|nr:hypothetical protein B0O99DRAFT_688674 [Bisporella sp. PMI_857]